VKDSSTIDFTYIPEFNAELGSTSEGVRVPIMPWTEASESVKGRATEIEESVRLIPYSTLLLSFRH
jgi:hypothetical protein